ncbi:MAG: NUDIX hydrolase [Eubacterium sp.]
MRFESIKKVHEGAFIHRYDISYQTENGKKKVYEMISRDAKIDSLERLQKKEADAVVLIVHDESGEKLLLNREFRLALGDWVYNFPAGLIEPGEMPEESGRRELREETGLELVKIQKQLPLSYSAIGFSNETNICLVGTARGEFQKSNSDVEEIQAGWFTKEEVRRLLSTELFAARTQAYCYLWSQIDEFQVT